MFGWFARRYSWSSVPLQRSTARNPGQFVAMRLRSTRSVCLLRTMGSFRTTIGRAVNYGAPSEESALTSSLIADLMRTISELEPRARRRPSAAIRR